MSATGTVEELFQSAYRALLPDLTPDGAMEKMFADKIARYTVLTTMATDHLARLDPQAEDFFKQFRQWSALLAGYERTLKFAYSELRRLQTERAVATPNADIYQMPRLARTAILTTGDRVTKQVNASQESLIDIDTFRTEAEFELELQKINTAKAAAVAKAA